MQWDGVWVDRVALGRWVDVVTGMKESPTQQTNVELVDSPVMLTVKMMQLLEKETISFRPMATLLEKSRLRDLHQGRENRASR